MRLIVNGKPHSYHGSPAKRLSDVLRDDLGLTGTKVGCNAGDCGACTVMIDGKQVCSCLTAVGQAAGRPIATVEGLKAHGALSRLQRAFLKHGAAQCGICTPGMLMAATDLLAEVSKPDEQQVMDAIGGVLCRCTGYRKIVEAVLDATRTPDMPEVPPVGTAVGARSLKVDGVQKVEGTEKYGADYIPHEALWLRAIRSPHARASFTLGDFSEVMRKYGLERVFTAADVPRNGFAIFETKDQPVLADGLVRYRGEAVVALVGPREAVEAVKPDELPIHYVPEEPVSGVIAAAAPGARLVQADKPENVLIRGNVTKGDVAKGFAEAAATAEGLFQTSFVEHAYIEPEAGWAVRIGDRIEIHASTQAPYMDRDEVASVMQLPPDRVRIVPTACGGGFGGKLDVSVQPLIALAAWTLGKPVACVYTRPESMASSTKRHPARITAKFAAAKDGRLVAVETAADFDTGAYASWGPTVANRVPVHASGPYHVPHVKNRSRALFTNAPPSGAFRGFGVPQAAIAHETLMDDLAARLGIDRLEMRYINAIRAGDLTATSQRLEHSAGLADCIAALRPHWQALGADVEAFNARRKTVRRGIGIGCMWYGLGNTSISNPSTMRIALRADGRVFYYNGAVDIGQGSNTIFVQIVADALGVGMDRIDYVMGDTDRTQDAGKTSASRQTFVSGKATEIAARDLRAQILRLANAGDGAKLNFDGAVLTVEDSGVVRRLDLATLPRLNADGDVLLGEGRFDPPTTMLDADGQGVPYATYGFAAQMALVEVDTELGKVKVKKIIAAHDVGKAVNPTQVEGQIHGGIAQGLGLALMEEYLPGRTENLHDYLIPTVGDVPEIDVIMIEDAEPLGPFGAKGVGEPGLVPTAPAILGAIRHATGVRVTEVPVLPHRLHAALKDLPLAAE
ncbi:MAG: molybdopterin-dependent oxidoreductase [Ferrovibrio sp.]|uniref:molybdopterin-dependent oxidoreductase n=1 Tax=Ferrovibrio sp. TaxID=1917215 RepID=UPI002636D36B|nr:molybdopterin cofactor-binding domain-containing protein [Ferrovibrio sp.]MCW0235523.1 molybdopterin-dependent oxidoreductase [Ferrovibrio sp.]